MEAVVALEVYRKLFMDYAITRWRLGLMYKIENANIYQLRGLALEEIKWISQYGQYISNDIIYCPHCPPQRDEWMHIMGEVSKVEAKPVFGHDPKCKYYFLELILNDFSG